jgi:hypothetical protein
MTLATLLKLSICPAGDLGFDQTIPINTVSEIIAEVAWWL